MAGGLPKRPLDFTRYPRGREAPELLAEETLRVWTEVFKWKGKTFVEKVSRSTAPKSQFKGFRR